MIRRCWGSHIFLWLDRLGVSSGYIYFTYFTVPIYTIPVIIIIVAFYPAIWFVYFIHVYIYANICIPFICVIWNKHYKIKIKIYLSIYLLNYVKNLQNYHFFFSTQCIILLLFLVFSQIKIGGGHFEPPPPIITKVYLPPS